MYAKTPIIQQHNTLTKEIYKISFNLILNFLVFIPLLMSTATFRSRFIILPLYNKKRNFSTDIIASAEKLLFYDFYSMIFILCFYSNRKASIGDSFAALFAGYEPKMIPVNTENTTEIIIALMDGLTVTVKSDATPVPI